MHLGILKHTYTDWYSARTYSAQHIHEGNLLLIFTFMETWEQEMSTRILA